MQKGTIRVVGTNLALILFVALVSGINRSTFSLNGFGMFGGLTALILTPVNAILSMVNFINKKNELGKAYLLATALCLLIGWSLCSTIGEFRLH